MTEAERGRTWPAVVALLFAGVVVVGAAALVTEPDENLTGHRPAESDLDTAYEYLRAHHTVVFDVHTTLTRPPRLVVVVDEHPEVHRRRLEPLLVRPDLLEIRPPRSRGRRSEQILEEIEAEHGGDASDRLGTHGRDGDGVHVTVPVPHEDVAEDLHRRYGAELEIVYGSLPYPPPPGGYDACPPVPPPRAGEGVVMALDVPDEPLTVGGRAHGDLVLRNTRPEPVSLEGGPYVTAEAFLVDPATGRAVSGGLVPHSLSLGVLPGHRVPPSGETRLPLHVSLLGCSTEVGYVVPDGRYLLVTGYSFVRTDGKRRPVSLAPTPVEVVVDHDAGAGGAAVTAG